MAKPDFDWTTEDGQRFRIYRFGDLEARTTQLPGGHEEVGVVFTRRTPPATSAEPEDVIVKVTQYVEADPEAAAGLGLKSCRFYVVLETLRGHVIATERLRSGSVTWAENPVDLETRNSQAKVLRGDKSLQEGKTVRHLKLYCESRLQEGFAGAVSHSSRKHFADRMYERAGGDLSTAVRLCELDAEDLRQRLGFSDELIAKCIQVPSGVQAAPPFVLS